MEIACAKFGLLLFLAVTSLASATAEDNNTTFQPIAPTLQTADSSSNVASSPTTGLTSATASAADSSPESSLVTTISIESTPVPSVLTTATGQANSSLTSESESQPDITSPVTQSSVVTHDANTITDNATSVATTVSTVPTSVPETNTELVTTSNVSDSPTTVSTSSGDSTTVEGIQPEGDNSTIARGTTVHTVSISTNGTEPPSSDSTVIAATSTQTVTQTNETNSEQTTVSTSETSSNNSHSSGQSTPTSSQNMTTKPLDLCDVNPCGDNGNCSWNMGDTNYVCNCTLGWTGQTCSQDVDECDESSPCDLNTSDCVNQPGSYECTCKIGFNQTSDNSCQDIDECDTSNQCNLNVSKCVNTPGSYQCSCDDGYTHHNNDLITCHKIDFCQSGLNNCTKDQICETTPAGFRCNCKPKYYEKAGICEKVKLSKFDVHFDGDFLPEYNDMNSNKYKTKVAEITQQIQTSLNETDTVLITKLKAGSIIAETVITSHGTSDADLKLALENATEINTVEVIAIKPEDHCLSTYTDCDPVSTICTGLGIGFMCTCKPGFEVVPGVINYCSDVNECETVGCPDGEKSICENTLGSFVCNEQSCYTNPCLNEGICSIASGKAGYFCSCAEGWTGAQCHEATVTESDYNFLMRTAIGVGAGLASLLLFSTLALIIACCTEKKGSKYRNGKRSNTPVDNVTLDNWKPSMPRPNIRREAFNGDSMEMSENQPMAPKSNPRNSRESTSGADNPAFIPEPDYDAERHEGRHAINGRRNEYVYF